MAHVAASGAGAIIMACGSGSSDRATAHEIDAGESSADAASGDSMTDAIICEPPYSFAARGTAQIVTDVFNFAGFDSAWAADPNRHGVVSWGYSGGIWLALIDQTGATLRDSVPVAANTDLTAEPAHAVGLAIASDGSRFGVLFTEQEGTSQPSVRFRMLDSYGDGIGPKVDIASVGNVYAVGAALALHDEWLIAWSDGVQGDATSTKLLVQRLAANGAAIGEPKVVASSLIAAVELAATPLAATAVAWQDDSGVRWAPLAPDATPGIRTDVARGAGGSLTMAAGAAGFVVGGYDVLDQLAFLARLDDTGAIVCLADSLPLAIGAVWPRDSGFVGVGAHVVDSSASIVQAFTVLDDCSVNGVTDLATHQNVSSFTLAGGSSLLASWTEYIAQIGRVHARPFHECPP